MADREALLAELDATRADFVDALSNVDAELAIVPGVMEDWSVRDLVHHLAVWSEHGAEAIELAAAGRDAEFAYSSDQTDAMNARFLAEGRESSPSTALRREESAFNHLRELVAGLDPALLGHRLGNGDTVEEVIRYDGPDHYREHTAHLAAWFGSDDEGE